MRIIVIGGTGSIGQAVVRSRSDGSSLTLTSGDLARDPIQGSASVSMVNGGVEAFARAYQASMEGEASGEVLQATDFA